jgi:hypothetical protein
MTETVHFCDENTGIFVGQSWSGPEGKAPVRTGLRAVSVDHLSRFDWQAMRVDLATGHVVDYQPPAPPNTEFETFAWDAGIKRWVATPTLAAHWRNVRTERDRRLSACDWVVARASERGEPVPLDWTVYRQALRDITDQPDPLAIRWPEPPA